MSDNLRRYCAIHSALKRLLPEEPQGNQARHLNTLAMLISGIIGSRRTNLPAIASKTPQPAKRESRIKRYERWLRNGGIDQETYFLPYAEALVASLPAGPLALVMDASDAGRGCLALIVSVVYQRRSLPLGWTVVAQTKGHLSEEKHLALLRQVRQWLPTERLVVFVEFQQPVGRRRV